MYLRILSRWFCMCLLICTAKGLLALDSMLAFLYFFNLPHNLLVYLCLRVFLWDFRDDLCFILWWLLFATLRRKTSNRLLNLFELIGQFVINLLVGDTFLSRGCRSSRGKEPWFRVWPCEFWKGLSWANVGVIVSLFLDFHEVVQVLRIKFPTIMLLRTVGPHSKYSK